MKGPRAEKNPPPGKNRVGGSSCIHGPPRTGPRRGGQQATHEQYSPPGRESQAPAGKNPTPVGSRPHHAQRARCARLGLDAAGTMGSPAAGLWKKLWKKAAHTMRVGARLTILRTVNRAENGAPGARSAPGGGPPGRAAKSSTHGGGPQAPCPASHAHPGAPSGGGGAGGRRG